jgi:hypothetical protein
VPSPLSYSRRRRQQQADCDITLSGEVNWHDLSRWLTCVCIVTFNLERGQSIEKLYPSKSQLDEFDLRAVGFLAFPDSNTGCMGDHEFFFRFRAHPAVGPRHASAPSTATYYFGTVYFRQVPDPTSRRGYLQKSLVIISTQPHVGLYAPLANVLATVYFMDGQTAVEAACRDVCAWPAPSPGNLYSLPILDLVFEVLLPVSASSPDDVQGLAKPGTEPLVASLHAINLYICLKPILPHLHLLWELMLTAEPLLVVSPSPVICSKVVLALLSIVSPLVYSGDYRPYFTIHCPESRDFFDKRKPAPPCILGVTNPVFEQALAHWPHVLRVGRVLSRTRKPSATSGSDVTPAPMSTVRLPSSKLPAQGLSSEYKSMLDADKDFLRHFLKPTTSSADVVADINRQNNFIRTYFSQLTHSFLIPLEQYITRLMPLKKDILATKPVPKLPDFHARNFLLSLQASLPQLQRLRKGNWAGLYGRFLKSTNFGGWLRQRQSEANSLFLKLYLEIVVETDLDPWIKGASEVEVVNLLMRIREALQRALSLNVVPPAVMADIQTQLTKIMQSLPDDLQRSLNMHRA